ncbi:MAG TPA: PRC-barrel domain-containing protein [Thermomicrobiales bacterium]|nr:PRC-barrel domain-containing protein [Thermomicrobiales bacterium]
MVNTMTWMPTTHADYDALKGRDVVSSDGQKVGTIEAIFHPNQDLAVARGNHYFLVKPGMVQNLFGGEEVYVPETALTEVTPEQIQLAYPKDQLQSQAWTTKPAGLESFRRS